MLPAMRGFLARHDRTLFLLALLALLIFAILTRSGGAG
jgi:hypothetical protein